MTTSKLEQALLEISGLEAYQPGDDRQAFLLKLTKLVDGLDEDAWTRLKQLCPDAIEWQYDAIEVADEMSRNPATARAIPDFPDLPAPAAAPPVESKPEAKAKEITDMPRIAIASRKNGKAPPKPIHEITERAAVRARRALKPADRRALDERRYARAEAQAKVAAKAKKAEAKAAKAAKKSSRKRGELNLHAVPETVMLAVLDNPNIENPELFAWVDKKTKNTRETPELNKGSVNAIGYNAKKMLKLQKLRKSKNFAALVAR